MNKTLIALSLALLSTFAATTDALAQVAKRNLHEGWRFRQGSSELWHPAKVPGTVHLDLMDNCIIDDPFFRLNDRSVQWIDKEDWMYETHFTPTAEEWQSKVKTLVFEGLDTYADIYLNHKRIAETDNMHRTWRCDVEGILQEGDNLLEVYFHSAIKRNVPKFDALDYRHNTGPDHSRLGGIFDKTISPFARTAGFEYGWDWGSRFVTSGIWRPVYLETYTDARIADAWYIQKNVTAQRAQLQTIVTVEAPQAISGAKVEITANGKRVAARTVNLKQGRNEVKLDYTIQKPRLWWTNGLGEAYLYEFRATVSKGNKAEIDSRTDNIGLRKLVLHNDKDQYGHNLYFELNGQPVFAKGSNMVPNDNFLTRCTDSVYHEVVRSARDVNMNIIRVWGGGIYEDDAFYKYCDQMGILVWQDFMFACQTYEVDSAFLATIRQEAIDNVTRLRNHPCLAVYAGNNEEQDVWFGWGGKQKYFAERGQEERVWQMQRSIFYETLPEVVREYGGGISYRPSSPWAFDDTPSDGVNGDDHYWGVWHGGQPFDAYFDHHVRFQTEFGFQSFPEYESVLKYNPDERDHNIYSEVMMEHQNAGTYANHLIEKYMQREYKVPAAFKDFLYMGQVMQADGVKAGMEAFRRDKPYCWGSIVWQLNDCWPVASWSSRDYYGRWKALHYITREAYDDILVSPRVMSAGHQKTIEKEVANLPTEQGPQLEAQPVASMDEKIVEVKIVSDRLKPAKGTFRIIAMTIEGKVVSETEQQLTLPANTAISLGSQRVLALTGNEDPANVVLVMTFETEDKTYRNIAFPTMQKDMHFAPAQLSTSVVASGDGYDVTVKTDIFARAVFLKIKGLDNFWQDNYFDLLPGEQRTVHVRTTKDLATFKQELEVVSMGNIE